MHPLIQASVAFMSCVVAAHIIGKRSNYKTLDKLDSMVTLLVVIIGEMCGVYLIAQWVSTLF